MDYFDNFLPKIPFQDSDDNVEESQKEQMQQGFEIGTTRQLSSRHDKPFPVLN